MNAPQSSEAFLKIDNLTVEYPLQGGRKVHAVTDFTAHVKRGETLGLVGESGCGKSSAARAVMQLPRPTRGAVALDGLELTGLRGKALQQARRRFQMIFQDPIASLNPPPRWKSPGSARMRRAQNASPKCWKRSA